jgi:hypothetical protein
MMLWVLLGTVLSIAQYMCGEWLGNSDKCYCIYQGNQSTGLTRLADCCVEKGDNSCSWIIDICTEAFDNKDVNFFKESHKWCKELCKNGKKKYLMYKWEFCPGLNLWEIIGITLGCLAFVGLIIFFVWWRRRKARQPQVDPTAENEQQQSLITAEDSNR